MGSFPFFSLRGGTCPLHVLFVTYCYGFDAVCQEAWDNSSESGAWFYSARIFDIFAIWCSAGAKPRARGQKKIHAAERSKSKKKL